MEKNVRKWSVNVRHFGEEMLGRKRTKVPPHIIIHIMGRFKGEHKEGCHLIALTEKSAYQKGPANFVTAKEEPEHKQHLAVD